MTREDLWLWAALVFGTASPHIKRIIRTYGNIETAYERLSGQDCEEEIKKQGLPIDSQRALKMRMTPLSQCEMLKNYCAEKNINILHYDDENYPETLRQTDQVPAVLFYRGNISLLKDKRAVAVVGARKATDYSLRAAETVSGNLSEKGMTVVSGFADGIDAAAHSGAGGRTIAVLGCGIDVDYPKNSRQRAGSILDAGGLIISEYLPGTLARPGNFPSRNRLIAALSLGVLVIQAAKKSGSLITAGLAADMGKDVFCIPTHDIFSKDYEGNTALLRDGAVPVFGAEDILDYYSGTYEYETMVFGETHEGDSDREDTEKQEVSEQRTGKSRYKTADPVERAVLDVIAAQGGSVHIDVIAEKSGYDISDVLIALTMLEMGGAVSQQAGKLYKII